MKKEWSGLAWTRRQSFGANLRAVSPLVNLFKSSWQPTIGLRGEYSAVSDSAAERDSRALSLLFSLEGRSLL